MRYLKGNQTSKIEELPECKLNLTVFGDNGEGIWAADSGEDEVYLLNHSLNFGYQTWGMVLKARPGSELDLADVFDTIEYQGEHYAEPETITLHPDAWDAYLKHGVIDEEGNIIPDPEDDD